LPSRESVTAFIIIFALQAIPAYLIISSGLDSNLFFHLNERLEAAPQLMLTAFAAAMASAALATFTLYSEWDIESPFHGGRGSFQIWSDKPVSHAVDSLKMILELTVVMLMLRGACSMLRVPYPWVLPVRFVTTTFTAWLVAPAYLAYTSTVAFLRWLDELAGSGSWACPVAAFALLPAMFIAFVALFAVPPYLAGRLGTFCATEP